MRYIKESNMFKQDGFFPKADKHSKLENSIYIVCWTIVLCIPIVSQIIDVHSGEISSVQWGEVFKGYRDLAPIFLLFVINNFVLLPKLFWKDRKILYFAILLAMLALLWFIQVPPEPHHMDMIGQAPVPDIFTTDMPPMPDMPDMPPAPDMPMPKPHGLLDMFHITNLVIELCIILANFGIKLYIQTLRQEVLVLNIQNEKMLQELQSLKYQISPHFLMNTLNNIQSLIESNPTAAHKTIQQLSKMMRYLLYDNNTQQVELTKEVEFMKNFIELMRIRYPESVKISADFPDDAKGISIPPLLFISFIENAFKYGVSYTEESLITVKVGIDETNLHFSCMNTIPKDVANHNKGNGIGIKNVQRRLDLIYGSQYDMNIDTTDNRFTVGLSLPLNPETI